MDRWLGKVAIVTGASSGIGAAIAESLTKGGLLVIGLARRLDKLEELSTSLKEAKGKLYPRQCDVSKEDDLLSAFQWVETKFGGVDILVNNAGVYSGQTILDEDIKDFRKILDVNVLATAIAIREAVASIKRNGRAGHIININSVNGHWIPHDENSSLYTSSKFAITAMTETVRKELIRAGTRIKITSVSPGNVETNIVTASGMPNAEDFFKSVPHLKPKDIADAVLYILGTPENVQVTELTIRPVGEII